jgi:hypothetical protein
MGHRDVVFDQEDDFLQVFVIQSQTAANFFGKFGPAADMAAALTFADVVQEQGQIKAASDRSPAQRRHGNALDVCFR